MVNAVDLRPSILTEAPPHCRGVYLRPQCSVAFPPQTHFHIAYLQKKEKKETQVVLVCDLALTRHWSETAAIGTLHRMEVYSACRCTLTEFALTHEDWPQQSTTYTFKADFIWRGSWAKLEFQPSPCETRLRRGSLVESNWPWVSQRGRVPPHGRVLWPHTLIWCLRGKSKIYKWKIRDLQLRKRRLMRRNQHPAGWVVTKPAELPFLLTPGWWSSTNLFSSVASEVLSDRPETRRWPSENIKTSFLSIFNVSLLCRVFAFKITRHKRKC